jgi:hypothetical protein
VGYIGPGNTLLSRALDAHAETVTLPLQGADREAVDLLVVESSSGLAVSRASHLVVPGGWIYWELGPRDAWRPRLWKRFAASGVDQVATHWHYRGFNETHWIVEIDEPGSVATVLSRRFPGRSKRFVSSVSRWIAKAKFLRRWIATSVIAQRSTA